MCSDLEISADRIRELERQLKAEQNNSEREMKEANDREDTMLQDERLLVERLLSLAHVVGDNFSELRYGSQTIFVFLFPCLLTGVLVRPCRSLWC